MRPARIPSDLIVLDIARQDTDGFEVARRLKADAATRRVRRLLDARGAS